MAESQLITRYKAENSDFLKKTKEAGRALDQFGMKGTEVGNKISQITNLLNINVGALSKLAVGLGAAGAALKVAGDAFKQNEVVMDEFNRNIEAAKGVYDGFLNALNTGDISGYLQNINNIVKAARDAYDAMDDLGTFNAFNQINAEENRANLSEALANFKSGTGSKTDITNAAKAVKDDLQQRQQYEQNAYESAVNALAEKRGVNADMLKEALSGKYGAYQNLKATKLTGTETVYYSGGMFGGGGSYQKAVATNEQEKLGEMLRKLTDDELQSLQSIGAQAKRTAREIADVDKQVARYMKEGSGGSGGGKGGSAKPDNPAVEGTIRYYQEQITALNKQLGDAVSAEVRQQIVSQIEFAKEQVRGMSAATKGSGIDLSGVSRVNTDSGVNISADLKAAAGNFQDGALKKVTQAWTDYQKQIEIANQANRDSINLFGQLGGAMASIGSPAAKVVGIMAQAIANIALAYSDAFAKDQSSKSNIYAFIGSVIAGTASMVATIAEFKNAAHYAKGGIVPGNDYSDNTPVMVSSGELILNRAQQGALANQLSAGSAQQSTPYLNAETIYLGVSNYLRRSGRGEIVTTR